MKRLIIAASIAALAGSAFAAPLNLSPQSFHNAPPFNPVIVVGPGPANHSNFGPSTPHTKPVHVNGRCRKQGIC